MRPLKLKPAQREELITRYTLFLENRPAVLAIDFGINRRTLNEYIKRHTGKPLNGAPR
jgi:hypothetical protein